MLPLLDAAAGASVHSPAWWCDAPALVEASPPTTERSAANRDQYARDIRLQRAGRVQAGTDTTPNRPVSSDRETRHEGAFTLGQGRRRSTVIRDATRPVTGAWAEHDAASSTYRSQAWPE